MSIAIIPRVQTNSEGFNRDMYDRPITLGSQLFQTLPERRAVIFADSSTDIGMGHLTRCQTLALQLLRLNWEVTILGQNLHGNGLSNAGIFFENNGFNFNFICLTNSESHLKRNSTYHKVNIIVLPEIMPFRPEVTARDCDQRELLEILRPLTKSASLLLVDHYAVSEYFYKNCKRSGLIVAAVDDLANRNLPVDLLIDQNYQGDAPIEHPFKNHPAWRYSGKITRNTQTLIGPNYALIRDEFIQHTERIQFKKTEIENIMISLGGSDSNRFTETIVEALIPTKLAYKTFHIIVGAAYPNIPNLRRLVKFLPNSTLHIQTNQMASLLNSCDLVIGAAGSSTWERAALGKLTIAYSTANNQEASIKALHKLGALLNLGKISEFCIDKLIETVDVLNSQPQLRMQLIQTAYNLVSGGKGAQNVAKTIDNLHKKRLFNVRHARMTDANMLLEWANEPCVRSQGFFPDPILIETHIPWLKKQLTSNDVEFYIIHLEGVPIGQVRFTPKLYSQKSYKVIGTSTQLIQSFVPGAEIHFSLTKEARGKGIAAAVLQSAISEVLKSKKSEQWQFIDALIKKSNKTSEQAFNRAGFLFLDNEVVSGINCYWLRYPLFISPNIRFM